MNFICMFCPAVISVAVIDGLLKEKVSYIKYIQRYCIAFTVVNAVVFGFAQYIFKYPQSLIKLISTDNGIVAKTLIFASVVAVCWGVIYSAVAKNVKVSLCIKREVPEDTEELSESGDGCEE